MKKNKVKDHYFMSRAGAIFVLTKSGEKWYLVGNPMEDESEILWPVGAATCYQTIRHYIKHRLGLFQLG